MLAGAQAWWRNRNRVLRVVVFVPHDQLLVTDLSGRVEGDLGEPRSLEKGAIRLEGEVARTWPAACQNREHHLAARQVI